MNETITTITAKKKILLARAGEAALPPIMQMVFGDGGVDGSGEIIKISEEQSELNHEIFRKDIMKHEIVSDTQIRYYCKLEDTELAGCYISELALADKDGDIITIKNFKAKGKDGDFSFTFKVNDTM